MKKVIVFLGVLVLMGAFTGCVEEGEYQVDGTVSGTVSVVQPGSRLVFESDDLYLVAFTDEEGEYAADLSKGDYDVTADIEGCELYHSSLDFEGGEEEMDVAIHCL